MKFIKISSIRNTATNVEAETGVKLKTSEDFVKDGLIGAVVAGIIGFITAIAASKAHEKTYLSGAEDYSVSVYDAATITGNAEKEKTLN